MKNEQLTQKESFQEINWVRPDIQSEMGEIERVAKMISESDDHRDHHYPKILQDITKAIETARLEGLTDEMWGMLENTDSYHHDLRPGHIEDVQKIVGSYRDWKSLLDAIQNNAPMQVPIILIQENGIPHLVAGNTRLMIARALGAKVQALIARLEKPAKL